MFKLFCSLVICMALSSCASPAKTGSNGKTPPIDARLNALLLTDLLLLGEQHDAKEHQQIHQQVIDLLAQRGVLAAVALEMADAGVSTAQLNKNSSEQDAQSALKWSDKGWPWAAYGPAVMTAIRANVLVLGANLPREAMRSKMADNTLDTRLPGPALKAQQQQIRTGHCDLLPESQIAPMTRIQIAKDINMAETLMKAATPGKVVVLLAGSGHTDRQLGVPQHLPESMKVQTVRLQPSQAASSDKTAAFDAVWHTPAVPERDYCADFKRQMAK